jgi:hypothetical protein
MTGNVAMRIGDQVEVRVAFNESWSTGFEVADTIPGGYQLRRRSDGRLLPGPTGPRDVRPDQSSGSSAPAPWRGSVNTNREPPSRRW